MSGKWHQNIYYVKNREKYLGIDDKVFYMSGWEYQFFCRLEENPCVLKWNANSFSIPYFFDGSIHKYFLDVYAEVNNGGNLEKYLIEIKPDSQTRLPLMPKKRNPKAMKNFEFKAKEFLKNQAKWVAASSYAKANRMTFLIITEKAYYTFEGRLVELKKNDNFT